MIHTTLCLLKNIKKKTFLVNKNNNEYYCNIFSRKVYINMKTISNIFKWMLVYHKYYIMIELTFLKELILIDQLHQKSVICVTIVIS